MEEHNLKEKKNWLVIAVIHNFYSCAGLLWALHWARVPWSCDWLMQCFLFNRSMFWTDWGHIPKIERATLSGTQRVSIVTSNLVWPFAIDLDRRSRLVFWVDRWLGRVESVDYHGNNRRILFQQKGVSFYGVTFFSFNLFTSASDWRTFWIYKLKTNAKGTFVSNINFKNISKQLFGLVSYDSFTQLPGMHVN